MELLTSLNRDQGITIVMVTHESDMAVYAKRTVHFVDAGVDTGAIINQKCVTIEDSDTLDSLMTKIHAQEHIAYPESLQWIAEGRIQFEGRRTKLKA